MATLTDEEKAAKLTEGVDEPKVQDEPKDQAGDQTPPSDDSPEQADTEAEKPPEAEAQPTEEQSEETFTKQFPNLKGDSWAEYGPELEKAYQNSWNEALKMRQEIDSLKSQPAPQEGNEATSSLDTHPAVQYAQAQMQNDMVNSFNDFAKKFPQARDPEQFNKFEAAAKGVSQGFTAAEGRVPTYPELFEKTATILGWTSSDQIARKDAAIKAGAAEGATSTSTKPTPKVNVTDRELEMARKLVGPNNKQDDSELLKDLATLKV